MSGFPPGPPQRPRSTTLPPTPHDDIKGRVRDLEHAREFQVETNARILDELRTQSGTLSTIKDQVAAFLLIDGERAKLAAEATKKADRIKNTALSVAGGLCLALIVWLAKIAMIVQTSTHP